MLENFIEYVSDQSQLLVAYYSYFCQKVQRIHRYATTFWTAKIALRRRQ